MTRESGRIIAISGLKGSGKTEAASYLAGKLNLDIRPIAQPIKEICAFLFDLSDRQLDGDLKEVQIPELGASPRQLMQVVGTELFKDKLGAFFPKAAKDFWVRQLLKDYNGEGVVIPDLRFPDEEVALRKRFSHLLSIRIDRPSVPTKIDLHRSETEGRKLQPDLVICNAGTLQDFLEKLEAVVVGQLNRQAS